MNFYIKPAYILGALFLIIVVGAISQQKTAKKVVTTDEEVPNATIFIEEAKPSSTPLPIPTTKSSKNSNPSEFQYPNSTVVSQNGNSLILESNDDPNTITNWYKDKIRQMGMNATAFSQTSVNGNISNKLSGAGNGKKIEVSITKSANQSNTTIQITL